MAQVRSGSSLNWFAVVDSFAQWLAFQVQFVES